MSTSASAGLAAASNPPNPPIPSIPSIGQRGAARIIDTLLILVPPFAILLVLLFTTDANGPLGPNPIPLWPWVVSIGSVVVCALYQSVALTVTGTTIGKSIMGLRVEGLGGSKLRFQHALIREFLPSLIGILPIVGQVLMVVGYLSAEKSPDRRHVFDRAAGTVVVLTR